MPGSRTHPTLPVACLPALDPRLRPIIERHLRYARIGSGWPDAIGRILSSSQVVDYLRADGSVDRRRVNPLLRRALQYIPEIDEIVSWGFTGDRGWMESHATYGPDWYVRRAREAWQAGNHTLLAFIMGLVTHQGEYLTAYKSLPLMFHGLPRDLAEVPEWIKRGGPFCDPHPYLTADRFPLKRVPEALNARIVAGRFRKLGWEGPATDIYRNILRDHYFRLFPLEAAWIVEHSRGDSPASYQRWREVAYRGRTHTCLLAASVVNDVLRPEEELVRREGDVLVTARCDLWRRKPGPPELADRRLPFDRLNLLGPLIKAGVRYELVSGDVLPEPDGFAAVLLLEETPQRNDVAFYRRLGRYLAGGGRVVVMGEPVYPVQRIRRRGRPDLFQRLVQHPGVVRAKDIRTMVRALGRVLGRRKLPLDAAQPTPEALALARELKRSRQTHVYVPKVTHRKRGRVVLDAVHGLVRCRGGRVLWDGKKRWFRTGDVGCPFREREGKVVVEVSPTAASLLTLPEVTVTSTSVLDLALRNEGGAASFGSPAGRSQPAWSRKPGYRSGQAGPAGGGFLVDVTWVAKRRRTPILHTYVGPSGRFAERLELGTLDGPGRLELTVRHALVDGLEGAGSLLIDRLRVLQP